MKIPIEVFLCEKSNFFEKLYFAPKLFPSFLYLEDEKNKSLLKSRRAHLYTLYRYRRPTGLIVTENYFRTILTDKSVPRESAMHASLAATPIPKNFFEKIIKSSFIFAILFIMIRDLTRDVHFQFMRFLRPRPDFVRSRCFQE